jgi:hypothetical protein
MAMDIISEWIIPGSIVFAMGLIMGVILSYVLGKLWVTTKMLAYRLLPSPIKAYGHYVLFAGFLIFAIIWTVLKR